MKENLEKERLAKKASIPKDLGLAQGKFRRRVTGQGRLFSSAVRAKATGPSFADQSPADKGFTSLKQEPSNEG